MRVAQLYRSGEPVFSFEFFPPKTPAGWRTLYRTVADLAELRPAFVSVTSHARGENRSQTVELTTRIQSELGITAMAHMTCAGQTREELGVTLDRLAQAGIENVMALRGDAPKDQPEWRPTPGGFRFVERARAAGITVPIVPGIMPLVSLANLRGALKNAPNSDIPHELEDALSAAGEDKQRGLEVGVAWATQQCRELLERGAPGIHFLTMNHSPATRRVHANLAGAK